MPFVWPGGISPWDLIPLVGLAWLIAALQLRAIERLAFERSMIWPLGECCPSCLRSIRWFERLPLLGWFLARGRCRHCGHRRSARPVWLPLFTFALLLIPLVVQVGYEGRWLPAPPRGQPQLLSYYRHHQLALFVYHAILFQFLLVATFIDFDWFLIPDSVTVPGTLIGLVLGTFWYVELHPVPIWPSAVGFAAYFEEPVFREIFTGGKPLPAWLEKFRVDWWLHWHLNWNRYIGFATSLVGLIGGGTVVWLVRFVFTAVLRREAMGLGDVTLMAMIGAFLGWQATVIIMLALAPLLGLLSLVPPGLRSLYHLAVAGVLAARGRPTAERLGRALTMRMHMPFGPWISLGAVVLVVFWKPLWQETYIYFSLPVWMFGGFAFGMFAAMAGIAWLLQYVRHGRAGLTPALAGDQA